MRKYNKEFVPLAKCLRNEMTEEEKRLWYGFLKTYPTPFARQKILGKYIADFYCAKANLVIELDGSGHYTPEGKQHDAKRTEFLGEYGLEVIRFLNSDIHDNFYGVCSQIDKIVKKRLEESNQTSQKEFSDR